MAIKALDIGKVKDYVCKDDDPDDPTIWKIGVLSSRDRGAIRDSVTSFSFSDNDLKARGEGDTGGSVDTKIERSKMNFEAVRRGLKGWENFLDTAGKPIAFRNVTREIGGGVKKSVVPNDLMDLIPLSVVEELAEAIMGESVEGGEADMGNSPARSSVAQSTPPEDAESAA